MKVDLYRHEDRDYETEVWTASGVSAVWAGTIYIRQKTVGTIQLHFDEQQARDFLCVVQDLLNKFTVQHMLLEKDEESKGEREEKEEAAA